MSAEDEYIAQEDKPRSRVMAECLVCGYEVSDQGIQAAIEADKQRGPWPRFAAVLKAFEERGGPAEAQSGWRSLGSYFHRQPDAAAPGGSGWRLREFYENLIGGGAGAAREMTVVSVRKEAAHLAALKRQQDGRLEHVAGTERTRCNCHASGSKCVCRPGLCSCIDCIKNPDAEASNGTLSRDKAGWVTVAGSERTRCNCHASGDRCACQPGACACGDCIKNPDAEASNGTLTPDEAGMVTIPGSERTRCNCGGNDQKCVCSPSACVCGACAKNRDSDADAVRSWCSCGGSTEKCVCPSAICGCNDCGQDGEQLG